MFRVRFYELTNEALSALPPNQNHIQPNQLINLITTLLNRYILQSLWSAIIFPLKSHASKGGICLPQSLLHQPLLSDQTARLEFPCGTMHFSLVQAQKSKKKHSNCNNKSRLLQHLNFFLSLYLHRDVFLRVTFIFSLASFSHLHCPHTSFCCWLVYISLTAKRFSSTPILFVFHNKFFHALHCPAASLSLQFSVKTISCRGRTCEKENTSFTPMFAFRLCIFTACGVMDCCRHLFNCQWFSILSY